jgi:hypothetical protein
MHTSGNPGVQKFMKKEHIIKGRVGGVLGKNSLQPSPPYKKVAM